MIKNPNTLPDNGENPPTIYEHRQPSPTLVQVRLPNYKPVVTYTIIAFTIFIYLLQTGSEQILGYDLPASFGMKVNDLIMGGQWWRLITPVFLHGSILHIGFNMYALNIFGPQLESFYGHWKFLLLYLVSALGGATLSYALTVNPSLGASTAVFGLLAANGAFVYQNRILYSGRAREALRSMITIAVINLVIGLAPGIDNWAHLGGLLGGLAVSWFGGPLFQLTGTSPELSVINQRTTGVFSLAVVITTFLFIMLAIYIR